MIGTFISIGLASLLLFYLIKRTVKIRVSKQKEEDGIDRHDFGGQSSAPIELRMVTTDQTWIYAPLVENIKAAQETDFLCQRLKARVQARTLARVSGDSDSSLPWSKEGFQVYEKELKKYLVKDGLLWRRTKEPTRTKPIDEETFQCRPHWVMYIPRHAASLKFHACYYELQKNSAEKVDDDVSTADTISVAMLELRKKYWWGNPLLTDDREGKGSESNIWAEMEATLTTAAKRYRDVSFRAKNEGQCNLAEEVPYSRMVRFEEEPFVVPSNMEETNLARLMVRKKGGAWELEGDQDNHNPGYTCPNVPGAGAGEAGQVHKADRRASMIMYDAPYLGSHGGDVRPMNLLKASRLFRS